MAQAVPKIRLFVDAPLAPGAAVSLPREQAHYLAQVMRRGPGDAVRLFNGQDGEWLAEIVTLGKRDAALSCTARLRGQDLLPDLWLCFAPIKKARTDFIVEKAVELGCRRVLPVFTAHTDSQRVNTERLRAHMVEAAEQCGLTAVPDLAEPQSLPALLDGWPADRRIMFCDETGPRPPAAEVLRNAPAGPWAVLIGPEGGFAEDEAHRLHGMALAHAVSLGPRIMRADTAAVAALTLWQSVLGDWT